MDQDIRVGKSRGGGEGALKMWMKVFLKDKEEEREGRRGRFE